MQFKSIIAALALAVAVAATPIEPVAVKLVERTNPPPATLSCPSNQFSLSKCSGGGVPLTSANSAGLISLIQLLINILVPVECSLNDVVKTTKDLCCPVTQGSPTNTQSGLINLNAQNLNLISCNAII